LRLPPRFFSRSSVCIMLTNLRRLPERATVSPADSGRHVPDIAGAASGSRFSASTFSALCDRLLGTDAGARLHEATDYPERSCYYYASGARVPPVNFILKLFTDEFYGPLFFDALMSDCGAKWWREREQARDVGQDIIRKFSQSPRVDERPLLTQQHKEGRSSRGFTRGGTYGR
jgi:hypothetical protein